MPSSRSKPSCVVTPAVDVISLGEARRHVLDRMPRPDPVAVAVPDALGLVLAENVTATEPVPPFANTAMDGFAVRASAPFRSGPWS